MAAPNGFPSFAYNRTQPAVIVNTLAAFEALPPPGVWRSSPFPENPPIEPVPPEVGTPVGALLLIYAALLAQNPTTAPATLMAPTPETETEPEPEPVPETKPVPEPLPAPDHKGKPEPEHKIGGRRYGQSGD
jgi:hypothetical protein